VILGKDKEELTSLIYPIGQFLKDNLRLSLHPHKITIRKLSQGIDFLGYVILPFHIRLRTKTKRRMLKKVCQKNLPSYLGLLKHCNCYRLKEKIMI